VLRRQFGQAPDLLHRSHRTGRIGRAVEQDQLGPAGDRLRDAIQRDAEIRIGGDKHRRAAYQSRQRLVHDEVRVENQNLVARVDQGQQRQHDPAAGPRRDKHAPVGVVVPRIDPGLQFLPQHRHALRQRVIVLARLDGLDAGSPHRLRHIVVRLTDGQIDWRLHLAGQVKHLADSAAIEQTRTIGDP